MWIGHFDVWSQDGTVMFRHSLLLDGGVSTSDRQCEAVLGRALDACEQYYPAFQFVIWAGKSAREAMDAVMFVTVGRGVTGPFGYGSALARGCARRLTDKSRV